MLLRMTAMLNTGRSGFCLMAALWLPHGWLLAVIAVLRGVYIYLQVEVARPASRLP